ncbi:CAP domain-containing protein [Mameliella sp.]|uniref:CAP domain-containing protein n=1 Tax=Mameliella sp. TaxID=1924940 RepID=UPI003B51161C
MRLVWMMALCAAVASCGWVPQGRFSGQGAMRAEPASRGFGGFAEGQGGAALNAFRAENGLPPLTRSARLEEAARRHAQDMDRKGFFDHVGPDGSNPMSRVQRAGYRPCVIAENIARGQRTLGEVMSDWAGSPGHRRTMLSQGATEYGLVRSSNDSWVMVVGRDGC